MTPPPEPTPRTTKASLTEQAAAEFVQRRGRGALIILGHRAEMAEELGHRVAAKTWHEMADAAARLLRRGEPDVETPWPGALLGRASRF